MKISKENTNKNKIVRHFTVFENLIFHEIIS